MWDSFTKFYIHPLVSVAINLHGGGEPRRCGGKYRSLLPSRNAAIKDDTSALPSPMLNGMKGWVAWSFANPLQVNVVYH
ncbi:uncharacterized protein PHALS_03594 [Plasmopara halstedii]|uniref:Uncharacterized protein n=1 Tax=Plasmopara halstedii TaxID=4781 RepID=A0A0P1AZ54_PLAHL|nr:uncharacterized protein PHALS_03594 [Plasmopara halstedii]CEG46924.1 hypothetical protein PHALS_03594 [Plasmopara halstedii]|eukprot:XP_024583293.1 hypothetical protein PHALS_03594 [Plasmopara halstedii]